MNKVEEKRQALAIELKSRIDKTESEQSVTQSTFDHGGNYYPWNDPTNEHHLYAKERLASFPANIRERITRFDLSGSADDIISQIPVDYGDKQKRYVYDRLTVQKLYDIISNVGIYKFLWVDKSEIVITATFFRSWMKSYPEFLWLMLKAKENFRLYNWEVNPDLKIMAINAFKEGLAGKRKESWNQIEIDKDGQPFIAKRSERFMPPPKWMIEVMLGINKEAKIESGKNQITELTLE